MSVLSNKRVLIIGNKIKQTNDIQNLLEKHGVRVDTVSCSNFKVKSVAEKSIDLILLNHVDDEEICSNVFTKLQEAKISQKTPIFILAEEKKLDTYEVLTYGASDYITPKESPQVVLQKINNIFSIGDIFSGNSAIDITPQQADITSTGIRVFVVEDDPLLRNLLATKLEKSSFPHEFSVNADGAISAMRQFSPQVIILDLMLPGKSGFELLAEIREDEILKDTPVIIFSNKDGQEDRKRAQELGVSAFRVKAMTDLAELIETIESLVS